VGFSRDGFPWWRPDRRAFIGVSEREGDWNWGNVQSAGGGCLVVGDELWFYVSGRAGVRGSPASGVSSTGLAILRRHGFASLDAGEAEGTLTTRPVCFGGGGGGRGLAQRGSSRSPVPGARAQSGYLFVNVAAAGGELRAEVCDQGGRVLEPFSRANCLPTRTDKTLQLVRWKDGGDLGQLAVRVVRFRFYLRRGSLHAFWVSSDRSGASHGYVAAGGPGFTGPTDTVGSGGRP
jgi:hypothetical protein